MAVEKDFHWSRYVPGIESRLSEFEDGFASTIQAIRRNQLQELAPGAIAKVMRHFALRLPIMRSFLERSARDVLDLVRSAIRQVERRALHYRTMQEAIGAVLKNQSDQDQDPEHRQSVQKHLIDIFMHDFQAILYNGRLDIMADVLDQIDVFAHVREMHSELLLRELDVLVASSHGGDMKWSLRRCDEPLVLGDVGPLVVSTPGSELEPLIGAPALGSLVLAVDSHTLLVGERSFNMDSLTASEWNRAVARLSSEFFIAGKRTTGLEQLGCQIGDESRDPGLGEMFVRNPEAGAAIVESIKGIIGESRGQPPADVRALMCTSGAPYVERHMKAAMQAYFEKNGTG